MDEAEPALPAERPSGQTDLGAPFQIPPVKVGRMKDPDFDDAILRSDARQKPLSLHNPNDLSFNHHLPVFTGRVGREGGDPLLAIPCRLLHESRLLPPILYRFHPEESDSFFASLPAG